jgi:deoxycytidine triphosphate deaminase
MVLGVDELLKRVREENLVSGLADRELTNPEGCGLDLRLGLVHEISGETFLGITERKTVEARQVLGFVTDKSQKLVLAPGKQVLVTTVEKVKMPKDLTANFWLRSTLYRSGVILSGGNVAPGYEGNLSFTIFNSGLCKVEIEMGARIVHILFFEIKGESNTYRGQWKGGRVAATKLEKQV